MNPSRENRAWPSAAVVFAAALALRIGHVLAIRDSPYFARPVLDAETYYWAARILAAGDGWAEAVYWQPPGYPYFLAAILRVAGPGFLAPVSSRRGWAPSPRRSPVPSGPACSAGRSGSAPASSLPSMACSSPTTASCWRRPWRSASRWPRSTAHSKRRDSARGAAGLPRVSWPD